MCRTVWNVFTQIFPDMERIIKEKPQNPIKIIGERFVENVKFQKPEAKDGKVFVEVHIGDRRFCGKGDNKKMAKLAAAKCAIRQLKKCGQF